MSGEPPALPPPASDPMDTCGRCGVGFNGEWAITTPPMPAGAVDGTRWLASFTNQAKCPHCDCINEMTHFKWFDSAKKPIPTENTNE